MKFRVPAFISKISTMLGDNSIRLTVDLQEMAPEQEAELLRLKRKIGYFFFLEQKESEIDLKDLPPIHMDKGEPTPSQELRTTIWKHWNKSDKKLPSEQFYKEKMEGIINHLKELL